MNESSKRILRNFDAIAECNVAMMYHAKQARYGTVGTHNTHFSEFQQIQTLRDYLRFGR
jgi:hypothetical protein